MPPTNYERGRAFEYRTRDALLKDGAEYVMRAASSKGAADLIALWPVIEYMDTMGWDASKSRVWLVQCKRNGKLPKAELVALRKIAEKTGALPVLAKTGPNGRGVEFIYLNEQEC